MTNIHISSSFYRYWGNTRLTNCSVGSSRFIQLIVFYTRRGNIRLMCVVSVVSPKFMVSIMFHTHWGNIRLLVPFHGIAQIDVSTAFCMRWGNLITGCFCGIAQIYLPIVFYMRCSNIRSTHGFCGIARMRVSYCVLHALGQYQAKGLLLWDRPDACFVLCFKRLGAGTSEYYLL